MLGLNAETGHDPSRNLLLDWLFIVFGASSWISINGLWVEMPLLVEVLPESWTLASYITTIVQFGNLGPISYSLLRHFHASFKSIDLSVWSIYTILAIGSLASLSLVLFWDQTSRGLLWFIGSEHNHSNSLFLSVFFLSLVDCSSSVLFIPYLNRFKPTYLMSYLIGEGMSGMLPALVALAQGVGGSQPHCENQTVVQGGLNVTQLVLVQPQPRISVTAFFCLLLTLMLGSSIGFVLINNLANFNAERVMEHQVEESTQMLSTNGRATVASPSSRSATFRLFLVLQAFLSFVCDGTMPALQPYSCLPYGTLAFHLSITLGSLARPTVTLLASFLPCRRPATLLKLTAFGMVFVAYIMATALKSPGTLFGTTAGGSMTVLCWIAYVSLFVYVKVNLFAWFRERASEEEDNSALFWAGAHKQAGAATGALFSFGFVNYAHIFVQRKVYC